MHDCPYSIHDLLPHGPSMVLLDRVLGWDEGFISCELTIRAGIPFFTAGTGVPSHVGLEYMAQCCGAYAGLAGLAAGQPVKLGFLLGTRKYSAATEIFAPGDILTITAREILREEPMAVFDCRISCQNNEIATAQLNLYRPENIETILQPASGS
jgi:predicted hotdog family 3-hydroxylacyl-ACP dehydratase